jgi:ribosomal protein L14
MLSTDSSAKNLNVKVLAVPTRKLILKEWGYEIAFDGVAYVVRRPRKSKNQVYSYFSSLEHALDGIYRDMLARRLSSAENVRKSSADLVRIADQVRATLIRLIGMPKISTQEAAEIGENTQTVIREGKGLAEVKEALPPYPDS